VLLEELTDVELGLLEDLDLADVDVGDGIDAETGLLDLLSDGLRDELVDEVVEGGRRSLTTHDLHHALADEVDAAGLRIDSERMAGVADSVGLLGSEGDAEHADHVAVKGLHVDVGLDERLPLLDEGLETVVGEVHTVECSEAATSVDLVAAETHLAVCAELVLLGVSKVDLVDTAAEGVSSNLKTSGLGNAGLAHLAVLEVVGCNDIVPLLAKERILCGLAASLLGAGVLAKCHLKVLLKNWGKEKKKNAL